MTYKIRVILDNDNDEDGNGKDNDDVPLESGFQEALEFQIESRVQEAAPLPARDI